VGDVTYYASGTYRDADGVLPTANSTDGGFRGTFGFRPGENLELSLRTSYTRRQTRWVHDGNNADGFLLNVGRGAMNYLKGGKGDDCATLPAAPDGSAPECVTNGYLFDSDLRSEVDHFTTGLTTRWAPTPTLSNTLTLGWDYTQIQAESVLPFGYLRRPEGVFWDENTGHTLFSLDYSGSLRTHLTDRVQSTLSWGGQMFQDRHRWTEVDVEGFAGPGLPTFESGAELTYRAEYRVGQASAGFFLQERLGLDDRLFLSLAVRMDGHSSFGDDYGLQPYAKAGLSYVLSDHDFWPIHWFGTFRLRGALGHSGKAPGPFDRLRTWSAVGIEGEPGFTPGSPGNGDLGPERTREIEAGFDASLWRGRLAAEVTYYAAKTTGALVGRAATPSLGFFAPRTENVGTLTNEGLELQLSATPARTPFLEWRVRTNLTFMDSEAIDLDGDPNRAGAVFADNHAQFREGFAAPVYVGDLITNPTEFADPVIDRGAVIGPVHPTRLVGVGTTLEIGDRLTIDALAEHQGGHYLPNYTGFQNARRGSWHPCFAVQEKIIARFRGNGNALSDVTALERGRCGISREVGYNYNWDFWIERADFWKLRSIMVRYELPESWVRLGKSATLSMSARNLFTWTDYSGTDPEMMDFADLVETVYDGGGDYGRRDYYQIPNPRTFTFSVRVGW
jgi:hypothetical protein